MYYEKILPHPLLRHLIVCYWVVENSDQTPLKEKIIPDGFTEVIFHYGGQCSTNISGDWVPQSENLLAGQLTKFFFLENARDEKMIAVKFMPAALTQLFAFDMKTLTDKVIDADTLSGQPFTPLRNLAVPAARSPAAKSVLDNFFLEKLPKVQKSPVNSAISAILDANGMLTVPDIIAKTSVGERQLERLFKRYVGLPPKYFARIIRFNYIFELIKTGKTSWNEIVYKAGYFDQSHFIRDFKAFTGEDPTAYAFEATNMANFFLHK